ncbi:hypothetical protein [Patulibacter medicamentivorans]|uniref:hypothetical protein n=1 Tax=Patulibacter medicamentivorans TaxID=1097667 RepID=UPI0011104C3E|nr:hypothetical protein [Patulibacter medicamentivorans]
MPDVQQVTFDMPNRPAPPVPPALAAEVRPREQQRRDALERANAVRLARATLKRAVQEGRRRAADVVAACPPEAASMPVGELLAAQHRWGEARTLRLLRRIPVPETKAVGALTPRQRRALVELLGGATTPLRGDGRASEARRADACAGSAAA